MFSVCTTNIENWEMQTWEVLVLNEDSCLWEAPVAKPDDGQMYIWDENTTFWVAAGS